MECCCLLSLDLAFLFIVDFIVSWLSTWLFADHVHCCNVNYNKETRYRHCRLGCLFTVHCVLLFTVLPLQSEKFRLARVRKAVKSSCICRWIFWSLDFSQWSASQDIWVSQCQSDRDSWCFVILCIKMTKKKKVWLIIRTTDCCFLLQTPLHFAAASTHGGICLEILVSEGANTKAQVRCGVFFVHLYTFHDGQGNMSICPTFSGSDIFWTMEPFAASLDKFVHHYQIKWCGKKGVFCIMTKYSIIRNIWVSVFQVQGHSNSFNL